MRYMYLIGLSILFSCCGKPANNIASEFMPLYDRFMDDAKRNGRALFYDQGLSIQFSKELTKSSDGYTIVGQCNNRGTAYGQVYINQDYWAGASSLERLLIIYHELGHCSLNEGHADNEDAIMYPIITGPRSHLDILGKMISDEFNMIGKGRK